MKAQDWFELSEVEGLPSEGAESDEVCPAKVCQTKICAPITEPSKVFGSPEEKALLGEVARSVRIRLGEGV